MLGWGVYKHVSEKHALHVLRHKLTPSAFLDTQHPHQHAIITLVGTRKALTGKQ